MSNARSHDKADPLRLAARAVRAKASQILSLNARVKALTATGRDIVLFGAGEPDFPTPPHIRHATTEALERGATRYTATAGIIELREAIAARLAADQGLAYAPDQLIVTTGAKMALFELFQAICDEGDEVILLAPYWATYAEIVGLAGGVSVVVRTHAADGFLPDPELVRRAITPRTRAILLNSPGNPTGAVLDRAALEGLAGVLEDSGALIVSDDIYEKILYDGRTFSNFAQLSPGMKARTVVINGVSKAYSMTGFRIGWAAGPKKIIAAMSRVQDQSTSGPVAFAQYGALAALTGPQEFVKPMVAEFERRRNAIVAGLRAIPGVRCTSPGGAFYALPSVAGVLGRHFEGKPVNTPAELCELLLERFDVALVPGEAFEAAEYVRLSFATSMTEIDRGLARVRAGLHALD